MGKPIYLYVTPFFPSPESWRGAYSVNFVNGLLANGEYDVRVFTCGKGPDYTYQGICVHRFPLRYLPSALFPFLFARLNECAFLRKVASLGIDLKDVAVCHANTALFGIFARAVKAHNQQTQAILHHHDLQSYGLSTGIFRHFYLNKLINFFCLRRLHEAMDLHVFVSEKARENFLLVPHAPQTPYTDYPRQLRGLGCFRGPRIRATAVWHYEPDAAFFHPRGRVPHAGFVMGCVANFKTMKDHLTLLKAVDLIRDQLGDWQLRLVGSGPLLARCQKYVREHKLESHITFESECDYTDLPDFYRSLDLFVLPSYFEGFGCVYTEALACGTPFIACEDQGISDILPQPNCTLCNTQDPVDLADKILAFYKTHFAC